MRLRNALKALWLTLMLVVATSAMAQNRVQGTVYEADGKTPMVGASVMQKGTSNGTSTDINGKFSIKTSGKTPVLVVQSVGYNKSEVTVRGGDPVKVVLKESAVALNDVVVTALGITREQKSLGYAVSKIGNEDLTASSSSNWLNSLSGKVAGLSMSNAGAGPISSMRVTLRGDQSLNYGSNEALFVVDGVPITSGSTSNSSGANYANSDAPVDFGNAAADINPDDVENVSVLKGPAATALYGSRAANGAIVITTKSGRKNKGVGVTINSSVVFERAGFWPDFQTTYGPGSDLGYNPFCFWTMTADEAPDGVATSRYYSRYAFGEKFDASKMRYQYEGKNWETGAIVATPWVYHDDWYTGLFKTGTTWKNTVTIDGGNGKGNSARLSVTDTRNNWILPNTGYQNQTVAFNGTTELNKWIKLNAKVNYIHKASDNMPVSGYDPTNAVYQMVWGFTSNSAKLYKEEYENGRFNETNYSGGGKNGNSLVYPASNPFNPWRTLNEATNTVNKDRVYGNVGVNVVFPVKGLTLDIRSGMDLSDEFRTQRKPYLTPSYTTGFYREQTIRDYEFNNDFLLRYLNNSWVDKRLGFTAAFGGNNMTRKAYRSYMTLSELGIEGIYNVNNSPSGVNPTPYNWRSKKVVNSFYGFLSGSWDSTYYLDITGRNDWSSALAKGYWSFFYPSVSASILLDKAFKIQDKAPWIDMIKARVSWANVGNDTSPYTLTDAYTVDSNYPGGYYLPSSISNYTIKPENVESWEAGLEGIFLKNRFSFDFAVYNSSTTNQIVSAVVDQIVGATSKKINAGEIRNRGIELSAHVTPIRNRDFEWSMDLNWSRNWNKLVNYQDGWDPAKPLQTNTGTTIGSRVFIYSYVGQEMNYIYGKGYQRAPEGSTYVDESGNTVDCSGMKIITESNGYPVLDSSPTRNLGKVNPDWRAGMTQRFSYKGISLSASFSAQMGGHMYSVTNFALGYQGKLKSTLAGRTDGLVVEGVNATTNADGTVTYKKNNTVTSSIGTYYNAYVFVRDNAEENTFKTDFLKCKEVRLDYKIPAKLCRQSKVLRSAEVGVFATNLFCITSFPQYDPEAGMLSGSDIFSGIETMTFPMTRSYGINVKLAF